MNKICLSCKHITSNVYGNYCSIANHKSSEYGHFWVSNKCLHDENNTPLKNLFEPVPNEVQKLLSDLRIEFNSYKLESDRKEAILKKLINELTSKP
jgi:hypothetical protein